MLDYQISPYLQELYVYGGQNDNYERSVSCIKKCLRIELSSSQMDRLSQRYGELLDTESDYLSTGISVLEAQITTFDSTLSEEEALYCMVDGSMLPTREGEESNDWKEVKLGRLFGSESIEEVDKHHHKIKNTVYVADIGSSSDFCKKINSALVTLDAGVKRPLIFVNDGGQWIWINTSYPDSVQILDYYHALEKISSCGKLIFANPSDVTKWIESQKERLFSDQVSDLILELGQFVVATTDINKANEIQKTLNYVQKHEKRMLYKTFIDKGYLIGSGPIESAHRVVLQKRLKQSGQRWTKKGAQNIINLRTISQANQWNKIIDLIKHKESDKYRNAA